MTSDAELVGRVLQGDVESFGDLIKRYEKSLLAAALARTHDIHAAEDVVQGIVPAGLPAAGHAEESREVRSPG